MRPQQAVLLVDHGSRQAAANQLLEEVAERVRAKRPGVLVEVAHMELAAPNLADGIAACVAAGAGDVIVHPYFLAPGVHTRQTIPALIAEAAIRHPGVTIRISEPLGLHDKLVEVVLERIGEVSPD